MMEGTGNLYGASGLGHEHALGHQSQALPPPETGQLQPPTVVRPTRRELPWNHHKEVLKGLYLEENRTLDDIQAAMIQKSGFNAT